jgi:predicted ester cyclase
MPYIRIDIPCRVESNTPITSKEGELKKLLFILPLVLVVGFMVGCQDKEAMAELEEFRAQAALEEENKAFFMRASEAWLKEDIETLKEYFSPDFVGYSPTGEGSPLEMVLEQTKRTRIMFPDMTNINKDLFAKGDLVVSRYVSKGTHTGDIEGFPATGKEVEFGSIMIARIENGKFVEAWVVPDNLTLYQQLGFEFKMKEEE